MKLAACVIVKNEGDGILEWGLYHHLIGFETLIIVDDESTDHTAEEIARLSLFCDVKQHRYDRSLGDTQSRTYHRLCSKYQNEFDWIAFIDADEFIFSPHEDHIHRFLQQHHRAAAIGLPWLFFGSSGHETKPTDLVLNAYTKRAQFDKFSPHRHVKMIVRPSQVTQCLNPHAFELQGDCVGPDGEILQWAEKRGIMDKYNDYSSWRINHYFTKSRENWAQRLIRGQLGGTNTLRTQNDFTAYNKNDVIDDSATALAAKVKARIHQINAMAK